MYKIKLPTLMLLIAILAISCNSKVDDQKIEEDVSKYLKEDNKYLGVTSSVTEGVVTLDGKCVGDDCVSNIENTIKEIDGVKKVENKLIKDNSTDFTLRTSVQSIITKYPGVQADVAGGVIVLRGSIDRENLQSLMSDLSTLNPLKIDNQLVVK